MAPSSRAFALLVAAAAALAACGPDAGTAGPPATGPSDTSAAAAGGAAAWCDPAADPATGAAPATAYPGWPVPGQSQEVAAIPVIVSSEHVVGENRLVFTLIDGQNAVVAAPDVAVEARLFDLARDPATPTQTAEGIAMDSGDGRTLYRAHVEFPCAGRWGLEFAVGLPGGETNPRLYLSVQPEPVTPALGEAAPRSESATASSPDELREISSDPEPDPAFYELSIAEAVTSGRPSVIAFATPAFCQTATCGPVLDRLKEVAADYRDRVAFVNVEPYELQMTPNGLQPLLGEEGQLQPVPAVTEWGLRVEPYVFVVDAEGRVAAKLEGAIDEEELRAELEGLLGERAPA
jgi:hypothetical protein